MKAAEVKFVDKIPSVEDIQDLVEEVLINEGHAQTAKAYILYRERRQEARKISALIGETSELFTGYLADKDWGVKENANMQKSVNGLNNYVREHFTKKYWLYKVYPKEVREAHETGDIHLHDLGFFGPYCAGWDVRQLLTDGFGGGERQSGVPPRKTPALLPRSVGKLHFHHPGRDRGRTGVELHRHLLRALHLLRQQ